MDDSEAELTIEDWRWLQRLALNADGLSPADERGRRLCAAGLAIHAGGTLRITPAGRRRLVRGSPFLWERAA